MVIISREDLEDRIRAALSKWRKAIERGIGRVLASSGSRPFFSFFTWVEDPVESVVRSFIEATNRLGVSSRYITTFLAGYELGKRLVKMRMIRSVDDIPYAFALAGIGLVDIVYESCNKMEIDIFECLSCFGSKPTGRTMCSFEAGALRGVLEELVGKNSVEELKCWGLGDAYCRFRIEFE